MFDKKLISKRDKLLEENHNLKLELEEKSHNSKVNDEIATIKGRTALRGGKYSRLLKHPEYRAKWKGTFFDLQRPLIERLKAYPLSWLDTFLEGNIDNPFARPDEECPGALIGYCDLVAPSKYGPIIRITDPYGSYTFPPLIKTPFEEAIKWVDRILIIDALYKYGRKAPKITRVQVLSFTLTEDLRQVI